ncbi:MAG: GAF domain-containing protein [Candidatus Glassbacteria bacterium]|nr:GAF domain-containing protein [Candidatus Glassbacteria bacterium]
MKNRGDISQLNLGAALEQLEQLCRSFDRVPGPHSVFPSALAVAGKICGQVTLQGYLYDTGSGTLEPSGEEQGQPLKPLTLPNHLFKTLSGENRRLAWEPFELDSLGQSHPWWRFYELNRKAIEANRIAAFFPLTSAREVLGLVALERSDWQRLGELNLIKLLKLAVSQIALGLSHLELVNTVRRTSFQSRLKALELETLQDVGAAFSGSLDLDQLTGDLLVRLISILNINRAALLLDRAPDRGGDGGDFRPEVVESFGFEEVGDDLAGLLKHCGDASANLLQNSPTVINDPSLASTLGCRNLMVVPVQYKGQLLGAILVGDKESRSEENPSFDDDDLKLLSSMAGQAGAAISNARLYSDVLRMKNFNENILTSIASGVITTDGTGRVASFNESASRIFALPAVNAIGKPLRELLTGMNLEDLAEELSEVTRTGESFQEMNITGKDFNGVQVVLNLSATPFSGSGDAESQGKSEGLVVSVENISEGARVKDTLRRYVSSNVVDMVLEEGYELVLGGKLCEVTVLFADIRGFTSLSERQSPQDVVELLNSYFDLIIDVVFRYNGTVDKIVGDEIMVLFGAPFQLDDDTERAVRCAGEMLKTLEDFNRQRETGGLSPLSIGIGLNRGNVISGNIGSSKHMDYTVIGDAVNLASRLVDRAEPGQILLTRSVADSLDSGFACRRIGEISVRGKQKPVEVFEIAGDKE